jgi:hypothetical protein
VITISAAHPNYAITLVNGTYTITKATYDMSGVSLADGEFTYDATPKSLSIAGTLPTGVSVTYEGNGQIDAGTYTVTAKFSGDAQNYEPIPDMTATLTIKPAPLTLVAEDKTSVYGEQLVGLTYRIEGTLYDRDSLQVTLEKAGGESAGEYVITISAEHQNYAITLVNGTYTITKATYDMSGVSLADGEFTYDATPKSLFIAGTLPTGVSVTYEGNGQIDAGTYTVTAKFSGDARNYEPIPDMTATLTIKPAPLTLVAEDKTSVYGEQLVGLTYRIEGTLYDRDSLQVTLEKAGGESAGEYVITISAEHQNYDISLGNGTYTITKATYDMSGVSLADGEFTYDATPKSLSIAGTLPTGVSVTYEGNGQIDAGTYTVTAKFSGDAQNYEPIPDMTATLTIKPAPLTLVAEDKTSVYGEQLVGLTYRIEGTLYDRDSSLQVTLEKAGGESAGEYVITISAAHRNYDISLVNGTYTITKATYDMSGVSLADGEFTYDATPKSLSIAGTLPTGVSVTYEGNGQIDAGTYTVTAKFSGDAQNYELIPDMTATLTIKPAPLTLVADDKTSVYGEQLVGLTYKVVEGTLYDRDRGSLQVTLEKAGGESAGEYVITISAAHPNYDISLGNGTYTITKATYDMSGVSLADGEFTYDATPKSLSIAGTLPTGVSVTYEGNGQIDAGTYTVTAKFSGDAQNYELIPDMTATLTIEPAPLTLVADDKTSVYGEQLVGADVQSRRGDAVCS